MNTYIHVCVKTSARAFLSLALQNNFAKNHLTDIYSTSGPPGAENAVLSHSFWVLSCKNTVLSQSLSWRPSKDRFFCFLGQYGVFASLSQKDWDSTALQAFQVYQWDSYKKCEPLNNRNPTDNRNPFQMNSLLNMNTNPVNMSKSPEIDRNLVA